VGKSRIRKEIIVKAIVKGNVRVKNKSNTSFRHSSTRVVSLQDMIVTGNGYNYLTYCLFCTGLAQLARDS
jgi:hypothetical protein